MAKKKHPLEELGLEDPEGEAWTTAANAAWSEAETKAERARAKAKKPEQAPPAITFYEAPALPDFAAMATEAVTLPDVLGRFVFQEGTVHDVSRAVPACRLGPLRIGATRQFVHFASELAAALPATAEPHAACMGGG